MAALAQVPLTVVNLHARTISIVRCRDRHSSGNLKGAVPCRHGWTDRALGALGALGALRVRGEQGMRSGGLIALRVTAMWPRVATSWQPGNTGLTG